MKTEWKLVQIDCLFLVECGNIYICCEPCSARTRTAAYRSIVTGSRDIALFAVSY